MRQETREMDRFEERFIESVTDDIERYLDADIQSTSDGPTATELIFHNRGEASEVEFEDMVEGVEGSGAVRSWEAHDRGRSIANGLVSVMSVLIHW